MAYSPPRDGNPTCPDCVSLKRYCAHCRNAIADHSVTLWTLYPLLWFVDDLEKRIEGLEANGKV